MTTELARLAGWSAYISGAAAILALLAIGLFFAGVKPFGPVNDLLLVLMVLSMAPIALVLFQMEQGRYSLPGLAVMLIGLAGMLTFAVNNTLMVVGLLKITTYERVADPTLATNLLGFFGIGLWMLAASYLAGLSGRLPAGLDWLGVAAGAGFVVMVLAYWRLGGTKPLTMGAGLIWQIGYPMWAIWLGRVLLSNAK